MVEHVVTDEKLAPHELSPHGDAELGDRSKHAQPRSQASRPHRLRLLMGHLALMLVSTLVSAAAAEVFLRCFANVQNVGPSHSTYDPQLLRVLKKNLRCYRYSSDFVMQMSTNALGLRGPDFPSAPRDCVLFLGDSQTLGHGVNDGEEYPSLISKSLAARYGPDRFVMLNTAVGGMGNGRWIKILHSHFWGYQPKLVVMQFSNTDQSDNMKEGIYTLSPSGELIAMPPRPPGWGFYLEQAVDAIPGLAYTHFVALCRQLMVQNRLMSMYQSREIRPDNTNPSQPSTMPADLTARLVEEAVAICRSRGFPIVLVTTDLDGPDLAWIEQICDGLAVPHVQAPTRRQRPDLFFPLDPHLNAAGQKYVAGLLEAKILAEKPLRDALGAEPKMSPDP